MKSCKTCENLNVRFTYPSNNWDTELTPVYECDANTKGVENMSFQYALEATLLEREGWFDCPYYEERSQ